MGFGAIANGGGQRLAGEHVGAIERAGDDAVEQHLPIGLRLERHIEPFILEIAKLIGNGERGHVGELDEAEFQLVLFDIEHGSAAGRAGQQAQGKTGKQRREAVAWRRGAGSRSHHRLRVV